MKYVLELDIGRKKIFFMGYKPLPDQAYGVEAVHTDNIDEAVQFNLGWLNGRLTLFNDDIPPPQNFNVYSVCAVL